MLKANLIGGNHFVQEKQPLSFLSVVPMSPALNRCPGNGRLNLFN